ncbi:cilia and flagella associated protein [Anaeramoeba ignava]|uniref:Cilia and flagella associated protein n=1 Tax=Anaeramoeba ignava TaxID=1746090 RepID=A0A9Q0RCB9_ANAIG|nr:cilia and flagella associated protein [Anaeramoeba ignava]
MEFEKFMEKKEKFYFFFGFPSGKQNNLISVDKKTILYSGKTRLIWQNIETEEQEQMEIREKKEEKIEIKSIDIHPKKKNILGLAETTGIKIIDIEKKVCVNKMKENQERISCIKFSPSGEILASIGSEPDVILYLWDWQKGNVLLLSQASFQPVLGISFINEQNFVTYGVAHLRLWEIANTFTGLKLKSKNGKFGSSDIANILVCVGLPNGNVLSGTDRGSFIVWTGNHVKKEYFSCHSKEITIIQILGERKEILSSGKDGVIRKWKMEDFEDCPNDLVCLKEIRLLEKSCISNMTKIGKENWVVQDDSGYLWKISGIESDQETEEKNVEKHIILNFQGGKTHNHLFHPKNPICVLSDTQNTFRLLNLQSKKIIYSRQFNSMSSFLKFFSGNEDDNYGTVIVSGFVDGVVRILKLSSENFKLISVFKPHNSPITQLIWNQERSLFVSFCEDENSLFVFRNINQFEKMEPLGMIALSEISSISFSNDWEIVLKYHSKANQIMDVKKMMEKIDLNLEESKSFIVKMDEWIVRNDNSYQEKKDEFVKDDYPCQEDFGSFVIFLEEDGTVIIDLKEDGYVWEQKTNLSFPQNDGIIEVEDLSSGCLSLEDEKQFKYQQNLEQEADKQKESVKKELKKIKNKYSNWVLDNQKQDGRGLIVDPTLFILDSKLGIELEKEEQKQIKSCEYFWNQILDDFQKKIQTFREFCDANISIRKDEILRIKRIKEIQSFPLTKSEEKANEERFINTNESDENKIDKENTSEIFKRNLSGLNFPKIKLERVEIGSYLSELEIQPPKQFCQFGTTNILATEESKIIARRECRHKFMKFWENLMKKPRNLLKPAEKKAILAAEKDIGALIFRFKTEEDLKFFSSKPIFAIEKKNKIEKYSQKIVELKKLFNNKIQDFNSKISKSQIILERHENARSQFKRQKGRLNEEIGNEKSSKFLELKKMQNDLKIEMCERIQKSLEEDVEKNLEELICEKIKLEERISEAELKMQGFEKEKLILTEMENVDQETQRKLEEKQKEKKGIEKMIEDLEGKVEEKKELFREKQKELGNLETKFKKEIEEKNDECFMDLTRIYMKNIKRRKESNKEKEIEDENEENQDIFMESGDDSFSDEEYSDFEIENEHFSNVNSKKDEIPEGCEMELFNYTILEREKRLDCVEEMKEMQHQMDFFEKEKANQMQKLSFLTKIITKIEQEYQQLQLKKKQKTNNVSFSFAIKSSQIKDSKFNPLEYFEGDGSQRNWVFIQEEIFQIQKQIIQNLQKENQEFLLEFNEVRKKYSEMKRVYSEKIDCEMKTKEKLKEVQLSKFGKQISLEDVEKASVNEKANELKSKLAKNELRRKKDLEKWDRKILHKRKELMNLIKVNTENINQLANLKMNLKLQKKKD